MGFEFFYVFCRGISWATKDKVQQANYFGSLTQASTIRVGSFNGEEIYAPFKSLLPMVVYIIIIIITIFSCVCDFYDYLTMIIVIIRSILMILCLEGGTSVT